MADGLQLLGVDARPTDDGMVIQGGDILGGKVHARDDHRIAMAFTVAGLRASSDIYIEDCINVNTSFPDFVGLAASVGLKVTASEVAG